ncbi:hypothetical protein [Burkholderia sp. Ac-20379]|uniref:hypothetical protein n=1 Tax=Burkholderia sp. Ac-20379 TaxID=2703900 RepID=UPI00197FB390|nr:hypothetical protein [Burkholderia sp. Ac-20379]MBN3729010.1 hypothetical protein [Burkholderia sp. Ac-20379]
MGASAAARPAAATARRNAQHPPPQRMQRRPTHPTQQERAMLGETDSVSLHSLHSIHETDITDAPELAAFSSEGLNQLEAQMHDMIESFDVSHDPVRLDANMEMLHRAIGTDESPEPSTPEQRKMVQSVLQFANDIVNNNFENPVGKFVTSAAHSMVARIPTVYGPTFLRQLTGQKLGEVLSDEHASKDVKSMVGLMLTAAPIALLVVGMMRDKEKGIATNTSRNSRLALMAVGSVMGLAAVGTGSMAGASASLGAFVLYCAMRDGMQQFVKLGSKDDKEPTYGQSQAAGAAYVADQMVVGSGMSYTSSPSGAGAAGQVLQTDHSAERAGWNMFGEVGDDLVSGSITAGGAPALKASFQMPTLEDLKNTATGAFPARATLFTASTLLSQIVADKTTGLSEGAQTNLNNLAVALLLGMVMYAPFAQMGKTKKPEGGASVHEVEHSDDSDPEGGPILPVATGASANPAQGSGVLQRRNTAI